MTRINLRYKLSAQQYLAIKFVGFVIFFLFSCKSKYGLSIVDNDIEEILKNEIYLFSKKNSIQLDSVLVFNQLNYFFYDEYKCASNIEIDDEFFCVALEDFSKISKDTIIKKYELFSLENVTSYIDQIEKSKQKKMIQNYLDTATINIVTLLDYKKIDEYNFLSPSNKKKKKVLFLTLPVFNKKKNIALINTDLFIHVYKKERRKWVLIYSKKEPYGYVYRSGI